MSIDLSQSIVATLAYFDVVEYPLTKEELYRHLWNPPHSTYSDFLEELPSSIKTRGIEEYLGYYFLPGRKEIVEKRREHVVTTEMLLKKAYRGIRLIRWIPFLKAIFICNSIASETATEKSDIDFFIITTVHRVWIVRFVSNIILYIAGIRRHGKKIAGRICLSFYIDEEHVNISDQRITEDDIHFIYWLKQMIPVYDPEDVYTKFREANSWTNSFLPYIDASENYFHPEPVSRFISNMSNRRKNFITRGLESILQGKIGQWLENCLRKAQQYKMSKSGKKHEHNQNRGVYITDGVIKLHEEDSRNWYRGVWLEKTKKLDLQ